MPIGWMELVLILVIALVVFGPGKLPEVGRAVGRGIAEFKKAARDFEASSSGTPAGGDSVGEERQQSQQQASASSDHVKPATIETGPRAEGSGVGGGEKA